MRLRIFKRGPELIGQTVGIAGEHLSGEEMATGMTRALGEKVVYQDMSPEVYRGLGFPGADDMGNMYQFKRDFNDYFRASRDVALSRSLNPELQTLDQWLARNASRIPIETPSEVIATNPGEGARALLLSPFSHEPPRSFLILDKVPACFAPGP